MADNTLLNAGSGGNTIRTLEDGSSIQWPVGVVAYATTVGTPDVLTIPTAAALADNTSNPTTLLSGACSLWYDGSTWDLARGDSTNGLLVNLGSNNDVTLATLPDTATSDLAAIRASVGGTLTVGSHAVTNAGTFAVQVSSALPAGTNAIGKLAANSGVDIGDVDVTSVIPGTGATNLGKAIDTAAGATDTGVAPLAVRDDALATLTPIEGDYVPLRTDANGALWTIHSGAISASQSGTWTVQPGNTANTTAWLVTGTGGTFPATQSGTWNIGTVTTVTTCSTVTNLSQLGGQAIAMGTGVRSAGTLRVTVATDDVVPASQSGTWNITNVSGTVSLPTGAATAAKQPALGIAGTASSDVITVQGIASMTALTVAQATASNLNCTEASAATIATNTGNATTALQIMDDWDNAASDGASVSGDVAHDAADAGEPVKLGAKATTSVSGLTVVADADRTNLFAGVDGVLITRPYCNLEDIVSGNASNTDGSSTQVLAAGAAGIKHYLTTIILTNTSSGNTYCEIKDGTTVMLTIPVPANGGAVVNLPVPLEGTAATAWNFDPGAATTTMYCSVIGFKSKV